MKSVYIIIFFVLTFFFSGCSPVVNIQTVKPAVVDMSSMRRLVVLDFDYYRGNVDSLGDYVLSVIAERVDLNYGDDYLVQEAAAYATRKLLIALNDTHYFKIITPVNVRNIYNTNPAEIKALGNTLEADAVLVPEISYADCTQVPFYKERTVYDKIKKQEITLEIPWVQQQCRMDITYRVIRATDNALITIEHYSEEWEEEIEEENLFESNKPEHHYREMIDAIIPDIVRKLAPYVTSERRYLKTDKSGNPGMERALDLVEAGELIQARRLFLQQWRTTAHSAAGYNAAILYQADGNLEEALELLLEIMKVTSDSDITDEYKRVLKAMDEKRLVEQQMR